MKTIKLLCIGLLLSVVSRGQSLEETIEVFKGSYDNYKVMMDKANKDKVKFVYYNKVISGANFQRTIDGDVESITFSDLVANDFIYSNKAFSDQDYKYDLQVNSDGSMVPRYNMNWQLIKANHDQTVRLFRNCDQGTTFKITKLSDGLHLLIVITKYGDLSKKNTPYFSDCKPSTRENDNGY